MRSFSVFTMLAFISTAIAVPQLGGILGGIGSVVGGITGGTNDGSSNDGGIPIIGALASLLNQIPVLQADAPSFLITNNPSPQCANINGGELLCCSSTINGDMPLVVELASLTGGFYLNHNSVNGLYCKTNFDSCDSNQGTPLCCQVTDLVIPPPVGDVLSLALWCQDAWDNSGTCS